MQKPDKISFLVPAILGIIGFLGLLLITKNGIGISVDSVTYIGGARNILAGKGFSSYALSNDNLNLPITRFPPLFSVALASIIFYNIDAIGAARLLNCFMFGCNIFMIGLVINNITLGSLCLSAMGSFLMLTSTCLLPLHYFVYSEPMFVLLTILGLYLICLYIQNSQIIYIIISGICIAMSLLTRYAGVPSIIAGVTGILLMCKGNYYKRLYSSLVYVIVCISPMAIWLARNIYLSHNSTGRDIYYHPIGLEFVKKSLLVFSKWLFPSDNISALILVALLIIMMVGFILLIYPLLKERGYKIEKINNLYWLSFPVIPTVFIIYCLYYLSFILLSKSLFDAYIPIDNRILSPLFGPFIIIYLYILFKIYHFYKYRPILKYSIQGYCISSNVFNLRISMGILCPKRRTGIWQYFLEKI